MNLKFSTQNQKALENLVANHSVGRPCSNIEDSHKEPVIRQRNDWPTQTRNSGRLPALW